MSTRAIEEALGSAQRTMQSMPKDEYEYRRKRAAAMGRAHDSHLRGGRDVVPLPRRYDSAPTETAQQDLDLER